MRALGKLMSAALAVAVALFGLTFAYKNHALVRINYYFGVDFEAQLPLLLFAAFALGLLTGLLAALLLAATKRRRRAHWQRGMRPAAVLPAN